MAHAEDESGISDARGHEFAHASEAEFARILDFYKIPYEYEAKSFVLTRDDEGNVRECFTPDFYLPDQDMYIELTTMKPSLAWRKNRKLKKVRELYPAVNVKLFRLKDLHSLMVRFGVAESKGAEE